MPLNKVPVPASDRILSSSGIRDSVSPWINDRYTFDEVASWFQTHGFVDVDRRADEMDHFVIGRRPG